MPGEERWDDLGEQLRALRDGTRATAAALAATAPSSPRAVAASVWWPVHEIRAFGSRLDLRAALAARALDWRGLHECLRVGELALGEGGGAADAAQLHRNFLGAAALAILSLSASAESIAWPAPGSHAAEVDGSLWIEAAAAEEEDEQDTAAAGSGARDDAAAGHAACFPPSVVPALFKAVERSAAPLASVQLDGWLGHIQEERDRPPPYVRTPRGTLGRPGGGGSEGGGGAAEG